MTDHNDEFGARMKSYEAAECNRRLDQSKPIYARIDGRSFSSFTRDLKRPFDSRLTNCMIEIAKTLVGETKAIIGYTQSDEISLLWRPAREDETAIFASKPHKMCSVLASMAAASLQLQIRKHFDAETADKLAERLPHFDARVINLPNVSEAANMVLWRAMDAKKNAVSMATRSEYSAKDMFRKNQADMIEMLAQAGISFPGDYPKSFTEGTWVRSETFSTELREDVRMKIPEGKRPPAGLKVIRSHVVAMDMPRFDRVANRIGTIFNGEAPSTATGIMRNDDLYFSS
jgi:tRNA(His) guanylyltransferase